MMRQALTATVFYFVVIAIGATLLAGCAEDDMERCINYGFVPGTPDYAHCRMNLDLRA